MSSSHKPAPTDHVFDLLPEPHARGKSEVLGKTACQHADILVSVYAKTNFFKVRLLFVIPTYNPTKYGGYSLAFYAIYMRCKFISHTEPNNIVLIAETSQKIDEQHY